MSATFGLIVWSANSSTTDWAGVVAAGGFLVALIVETYILRQKPERTWYEGRAAAESVKTLAWRYSVGGNPFAIDSGSPEAIDALFLEKIDDVLEVLADLDIGPPPSSAPQISNAMRELRASSLEQRRAAYENDRVTEQQEWYRNNSRSNRRLATNWTVAMLLIEFTGLVAAIMKATGAIRADFLSLAATIVAIIAAWLQTKQHSTLATAYAITANELGSVRSMLSYQTTDGAWADFVDHAEEAFSREHTLWKASRGVR